MTDTPAADSGPARGPLPTVADILAHHHPSECGERFTCISEIVDLGWARHVEDMLAMAMADGINPARQTSPEPSEPTTPRKATQFRGGRTPGKPKTPKDIP